MMDKRYSSYLVVILVLFMIGMAVHAESFIDYEDKAVDPNLLEIYDKWLERNGIDSIQLMEPSYERPMIRKSQRSPSLRLRFGRSGSALSPSVFSRADRSSNYDDN